MCIQTHTPHIHMYTHTPLVLACTAGICHSWKPDNIPDESLIVLEKSSFYSKANRMQPGGSTEQINQVRLNSKNLREVTVITLNPTDEKLQGINCVDILMS